MPEQKRIPVGRIVGAFGLKGQLKVETLTAHTERFEKGATLYLDGEPLVIKGSQIHKGRLLLSFAEFPNLTAAEKLQWKTLEADALEEIELEEDEFMTEDLLGLMVLSEDGRPLGKVDQVLAYPAHDILVIGKIMIPAVKEFIRKVDIKQGQIVVRLLEGMEE